MSSNTKHTPGPWKVAENVAGQIKIFVGRSVDDFDYKVCTVHGTPTIGQSEANAKIIAAAPEMLEVLTTVYTTMKNNGLNGGHWKEHVEAMKRVIKKATS